jgi:dihydroflavonol-4-reductase
MTNFIFVTGATGLVGSRLVFDLVTAGKKVRVLVREGSNRSRIVRQFKGQEALMESSVEWATGDINDVISLREAMQGVKQVYHCAGLVTFQPGKAGRLMEVNGVGTANVVNMALEAGVEQFCHVSSIAALGRNSDGEHIDESGSWKASGRNSAYAISKYAAEREVWRGMAEGLQAVIVNPGVILGPGNWKTDSSMLFGQVWNGLKFYTRGITGFVDVRDVTAVMIGLMEKHISGERYVLVSENRPFREVMDRIADGMEKKRAQYYAGPLLTGMAWRMERVKSLITGRSAVITRETARSASSQYFYSSAKISNELGISFIPVDQSVDETTAAFVAEKKSKLISRGANSSH